MVLGLTAADIGRRVVVRRRIDAGERPLYTDLLGELRSIDASGVVIRTASDEVRVPLNEIHRAKTVPERRGVTAREVAALELAAAEAWPPTELAWLGDWRLRAAGGYTGRANSALPVGDPGVSLGEAIGRVVEFYRERGLPPQVDVPLPLAGPVERELIKAGWHPECTVYLQVMALDELIAATPEATGWTLAAQPSAAALEIVAGRRGPLPEAARHVLTAVADLRFAEYAESGDLLAMARGSVTRQWLGLFAIETVTAARRRGLARQAVGVLARWARTAGARNAFLQVESTNTTAMALYEKLGFSTHHRYTRYRKVEA
ncbi:GNAT family N-acetyltransferase [Hamadaea tsunoensis]|uniref:GNAT family N-acetyltransferase n=1 Tax=Hamadaea tsunoensis TaxID=53368 RepID=UPI0004201346|nr:GNAT family N-acetyltransferase [Hamadaea tsunoensis]